MLHSLSRRLKSTLVKSNQVPADISKVVTQGRNFVE